MNAQLKPQQPTSSTHPVRVYRDWHKVLRAETLIMIDDTKELTISTAKSNSGMLITSANVMHLTGDGGKSCVLFQDFYESRVLQSKPGRVTEKVILAQHGQVDIDALVQKAKAFYHI